jgi:hypothetical protein
MNYIIKHDFNEQTVPYYVRLVDDKTFDEIYDPTSATQFNTKKEAQKWIDTYSSMAEYSKVVETADAIQEYEKWVKSGSIRRTLSCVNTSMSRPYNDEPLDEVIDWWVYATENEGEIKYEHYETWPELHEISDYLFGIEHYSNEDYSDTVITFQIYTSRKGKFKQFEFELGKVLDKVTYKDDEGYLIFPIFDHYLSEGGNSVSLMIHPETKKVKIEGRYGWDYDEFSSLKEAFEYMKEERYYE